jgi:hypothetical protein
MKCREAIAIPEHTICSLAPIFLLAGALIAMLSGSRAAWAQNGEEFAYPAYSFETDLQGFAANPPTSPGLTVTQDTIGATDGTKSMKLLMAQAGFFEGALTGTLTPQIGDPPVLDFVTFDLTLTEAFPAVGFVQAGITIFGNSQPDFPGGPRNGEQVQFFLDEAPIGDLAVGTHQIRMDFSIALHPLTNAPGTFKEIFGTLGSGPNDVIPTGFQIYINKSTQAQWTGYIDNIRMGIKFNANFNGDANVNADDLTAIKNSFGLNAGGDADGDLDTDGNDLLILQRQLGPVPVVASVPEPSAICLLGSAVIAVACRGCRRRSPR